MVLFFTLLNRIKPIARSKSQTTWTNHEREPRNNTTNKLQRRSGVAGRCSVWLSETRSTASRNCSTQWVACDYVQTHAEEVSGAHNKSMHVHALPALQRGVKLPLSNQNEAINTKCQANCKIAFRQIQNGGW